MEISSLLVMSVPFQFVGLAMTTSAKKAAKYALNARLVSNVSKVTDHSCSVRGMIQY